MKKKPSAENTAPKIEEKEPIIFEGSINFKITITDDSYGITYNESPANELAIFMTAKNITAKIVKNLKANLKEVSGHEKRLTEVQLTKVAHCDNTIHFIAESFMNELLRGREAIKEVNSTIEKIADNKNEIESSAE
jgi:hypothetical protein